MGAQSGIVDRRAPSLRVQLRDRGAAFREFWGCHGGGTGGRRRARPGRGHRPVLGTSLRAIACYLRSEYRRAQPELGLREARRPGRDKCPRQTLGTAVTAERNPDTVQAALKMYCGHAERTVNCDSFNQVKMT